MWPRRRVFLPAEVTQVGVIAEKRQTSMLLIFSLYSSDNRYDQQFEKNRANINVVPGLSVFPGVGDAIMMGADYRCIRLRSPMCVMAEYAEPSDGAQRRWPNRISAAPGQLASWATSRSSNDALRGACRPSRSSRIS